MPISTGLWHYHNNDKFKLIVISFRLSDIYQYIISA